MQYVLLLTFPLIAVASYWLHRKYGPLNVLSVVTALLCCLLSWAALHFTFNDAYFVTQDSNPFASVEQIMEEEADWLWLARYLTSYWGPLPGLVLYSLCGWVWGVSAHRLAIKSNT